MATNAPTSSTAVGETTLRFAYGAVTGFSLLPGVIAGKIFIDPLYDALVGLDDNHQLAAGTGFVNSWTVSPDGLAWTLKTRNGLLFHDGSGATAKDLKFSLDWYVGPNVVAYAANSASRARVLKQVDVLDDGTALATLKTPDLFFLENQLSLGSDSRSGGYLLPASYMGTKGFEEAGRRPVGSGPFRYVSDTPNLEVQFEAVVHPHWLYGSPRFRTVHFLFIGDDTTRVALIQDGRANGGIIPRNQAPAFRNGQFDIVSAVDERFAYIDIFEQYNPTFSTSGANPLADVRVRQALSLAIDREALARQQWGGLVTPTVSPLVPRDRAFKAYAVPPQNLAAAKQLLAAAGYADGFALDMNILRSIPGMEEGPQVDVAIAAWWQQLGLKVNQRPVSHITVVSTAESSKSFGVPTVTGVWWGPPSNPYSGLPPNTAFASVGYAGNPGIHTAEDKDLAELSLQLAQARSIADYVRLSQRSAELVMERVTVLPLAYGGAIYAVRKGYGGERWKLGKQTVSLNLVALLSGRGELVR